MKIAILTQPLHTNYGGILQAYALQKVLKDMGHQVIILNRQYPYPPVRLALLRILSVVKCIIRKFILGQKEILIMNPFSPDYRIYKMEDHALKHFIHQHISRTQPLRSSKALSQYLNSHRQDAIIVGSDQVWRQEYSPCIIDFFLSFLPDDCTTKRIAYAASFGTSECDIASAYKEICMNAVHKFHTVSVRENTGKGILLSMGMANVSVVSDPTLLLSEQDYEVLMDKQDRMPHGRITSYILDEEEDKKRIVDDVAASLRLSQLSLSISVRKGGCLSSPSQWLSSMADAEFIVTDSFHGCVFSILFNKPFIAIANRDRGIDRFQTLLGHFDLQNRLVFSFEEYKKRKDELLLSIDYKKVNMEREKLASLSKDFLLEALS